VEPRPPGPGAVMLLPMPVGRSAKPNRRAVAAAGCSDSRAMRGRRSSAQPPGRERAVRLRPRSGTHHASCRPKAVALPVRGKTRRAAAKPRRLAANWLGGGRPPRLRRPLRQAAPISAGRCAATTARTSSPLIVSRAIRSVAIMSSAARCSRSTAVVAA
jgi:hypothetical protein